MLNTINLGTVGSLLALPGFRSDLQGPRTRGSTTEFGLDSLDPTTKVVVFEPEDCVVDVAIYLQFDATALKGCLGAKRFGNLTEEERKILKVRNGAHGVELYLDQNASEAAMPPAPIGVAILGPIDQEGTIGWWTWYVADDATKVTGTMTARGSATNHPAASIAVKLHNG